MLYGSYGLLCVDEIPQHDFFRTVFDAVHDGNPSHLITGFEGFSHAFGLGHLGGEALHHLVGLPVDILQVGVHSFQEKYDVGTPKKSVL